MIDRVESLGVDLFGDVVRTTPNGIVSQKFGFPPFSVLDARSGDWVDRKRRWKDAGLQSEVGRDAASIHCPTSSGDDGASGDANYTSIFDPVLCECAYRWFTPTGAQIVDPFAGGSVRGVVAGAMGRRYFGVDLRAEQVGANKEQASTMDLSIPPVWINGDSMEVLDGEECPKADFVFSCPPYGDLEQYSDDPRDLSSMEWPTFVAAYSRIIMRSVRILKNDRFACFVVGDFRDAKGFYRNFVGATVSAFEQCRARLYNEAVLVTSVGSASMRVSRQFEASRKFAKTHQNVLVFVKGDPVKAAAFARGESAKGEVEE